MMTCTTSELKAVRTGLWLKRIGSILLLIVLPLSLISMSPYIIMAMAAFRHNCRSVGKDALSQRPHR